MARQETRYLVQLTRIDTCRDSPRPAGDWERAPGPVSRLCPAGYHSDCPARAGDSADRLSWDLSSPGKAAAPVSAGSNVMKSTAITSQDAL